MEIDEFFFHGGLDAGACPLPWGDIERGTICSTQSIYAAVQIIYFKPSKMEKEVFPNFILLVFNLTFTLR